MEKVVSAPAGGGRVGSGFEIGSLLNPLSQANNGEGDQARQKSMHCHLHHLSIKTLIAHKRKEWENFPCQKNR